MLGESKAKGAKTLSSRDNISLPLDNVNYLPQRLNVGIWHLNVVFGRAETGSIQDVIRA